MRVTTNQRDNYCEADRERLVAESPKAAALPGTAILALSAMLIATFFGLLLGGVAALQQFYE